jgi:hypothetical protein
LYTNIYSYLETYGGQSSNLYLNVVHFFNSSFLDQILTEFVLNLLDLDSTEAGKPYLGGRLSTVDLRVLAIRDNLLFKLKVLFTF